MASPQTSEIYTGPWINWSKGAVLGSTITLTARNGSLLVAFLGIFVTVTGASFWRILCFLIHQQNSKPQLQDAAHHQQQVILRNSSTPSVGAWQLLQVVWSWRKINRRALWRGIPLLLLAVCNMGLFAIAGVFSSEVTKAAGNETLLRSPDCGFLVPIAPNNLSDFNRTVAFNALIANQTLSATAYSRACYDNAISELQCHQYAQPKISWQEKKELPCPFGENICKDPFTFEMDTGYIDSQHMLGINTKAVERLEFRKVSTCSILKTKEYSKYVNITNDYGELQQLLQYSYTVPSPGKNFTFQYNLNDGTGFTGYALASYFYSSGSDNELIPALNRSDADITLMFLAPNAITYNEPVLDPWFQATIPVNFTRADGTNLTQYAGDYWNSVLACADQVQIRNPSTGRSTPLTSFSSVSDDLEIGLTDLQFEMFLVLFNLARYQATWFNVKSRGASALRASDTLDSSTLIQDKLPDDQWIREARELFSVSMAKLQQQISNYAIGPASVPTDLDVWKGDPDLCQRIKIRGIAGYTSFSVLGIAIILIVGSLLILTGLMLDCVVGCVRRRFDLKDYRRLQWAVDEKLQLQRLAFEGVGQGSWTGGADAVPLTLTADASFGFAAPEINKSHPRYGQPTIPHPDRGSNGPDVEAWSKVAHAQVYETRPPS